MRRLLLGAGLLFAFALAAPARAATTGVDVANFAFKPATVNVAPGDTVTWTFKGPDLNHSVTSSTFDSDPGNSMPLHVVGDTFSHTFPDAGTFSYMCKVHSFMTGKVVVGTPSAPPPPDRTAPTITSVKVKGRKVSFSLSEDASVKLTLRRSGATAKSSTHDAGRGTNSIKLKKLRKGRYSLKLVATDAAGNHSSPAKKRFRVR
jgi:plastocyanin